VWQNRIQQLVEHQAMTKLPSLADRETLDTWPFDILDPEHLITLRDELQAIGPDLVIIDTLRESHSADENDSTEMQGAIAALVAATKPAAVCLISHARKPSQDGDYSLMADNRGSNYVVGRMDAIVRFTSKSARVSGRSIEEHSISLERADSGFWEVPIGEFDHIVDQLLVDHSHPSIRAKAKVLASMIDRSEQAARGLIRRRVAALGAAHPSSPTGSTT
jgi:hypothetical protein